MKWTTVVEGDITLHRVLGTTGENGRQHGMKNMWGNEPSIFAGVLQACSNPRCCSLFLLCRPMSYLQQSRATSHVDEPCRGEGAFRLSPHMYRSLEGAFRLPPHMYRSLAYGPRTFPCLCCAPVRVRTCHLPVSDGNGRSLAWRMCYFLDRGHLVRHHFHCPRPWLPRVLFQCLDREWF